MKVGEGVSPPIGIHYAWTSDHLILFRFDMVWPKKHNEGGGRGVPPLGILMKEGYYGKNCEYGWAMHFRSWCLFCSTGDLSCMDLGYCWFLGHTGSLWKAASLVPGKAKATRRGLMGFASFCIILFCFVPFFGGEIGGVLQCDAVTWLLESIGMIWNPIQSMSRQVETCWLFFHSCWFNGFRGVISWMDLGRWDILARFISFWQAEPIPKTKAAAKAKASWLQSNPIESIGWFYYCLFIFYWWKQVLIIQIIWKKDDISHKSEHRMQSFSMFYLLLLIGICWHDLQCTLEISEGLWTCAHVIPCCLVIFLGLLCQ